MNIRERNLTAAIWFLALWSLAATVACFGLSQKLGRCESGRTIGEPVGVSVHNGEFYCRDAKGTMWLSRGECD